MAKSILVSIFGDAKQFAAELDRAAGKTRQFGKVAGVAGLAIAGGLALGLDKSVKAAMEGQASQAALDAALKATHQSVEAMTPALEEAQAASRKLGFTDDDTRASLSRLETATGDTTKSVKDLSVAQDIARFKHIDLTNASQMLAQAMTGSQRAARQLGIAVSPVTTNLDALKTSGVSLTTSTGKLAEAHAKLLDKMATGDAVIAAVTERVSGQGQAYADTAAGGMEQYHAQMQHLEETLGAGLIPVLSSAAVALATVASYFSQHTVLAKLLVVALGALAAALIAVSVATKVVAAAQAIMTAGQWALNAALTANPIGLIIVGLVALGAALVVAYKHSQTFRDIVAAAMNVVKDAIDSVWTAMQTVASVAEKVWAFVEKIVKVAKKAISGEIDGIVSDFNAVVSVLRDIENAAGAAWSAASKVAGLPGKVAGGIGGFVGGLVPHFDTGGVVPGPVGAATLAVVHGGETVIPVGGRMGGGGGGVTTVQVTVQGFVGSEQELAAAIVEAAATPIKGGRTPAFVSAVRAL